MPRRSYENQLNPYSLIPATEPVSVRTVLRLLVEAEAHHKSRRHHETGAYLSAAMLALQRLDHQIEAHLQARMNELHELSKALRMGTPPAAANPISPAAAGPREPGAYSHSAVAADVAGELRYANKRGSADSDDDGNVCECGHTEHQHTVLGVCHECDCNDFCERE